MCLNLNKGLNSFFIIINYHFNTTNFTKKEFKKNTTKRVFLSILENKLLITCFLINTINPLLKSEIIVSTDRYIPFNQFFRTALPVHSS
jgi:hypothetical protein